jgi:hypothetical protein
MNAVFGLMALSALLGGAPQDGRFREVSLETGGAVLIDEASHVRHANGWSEALSASYGVDEEHGRVAVVGPVLVHCETRRIRAGAAVFLDSNMRRLGASPAEEEVYAIEPGGDERIYAFMCGTSEERASDARKLYPDIRTGFAVLDGR